MTWRKPHTYCNIRNKIRHVQTIWKEEDEVIAIRVSAPCRSEAAPQQTPRNSL